MGNLRYILSKVYHHFPRQYDSWALVCCSHVIIATSITMSHDSTICQVRERRNQNLTAYNNAPGCTQNMMACTLCFEEFDITFCIVRIISKDKFRKGHCLFLCFRFYFILSWLLHARRPKCSIHSRPTLTWERRQTHTKKPSIRWPSSVTQMWFSSKLFISQTQYPWLIIDMHSPEYSMFGYVPAIG